MKSNAAILSLGLSFSLALSACGDDAAEQCEELFTAVCQRLTECAGADFNACFNANANSPPPCSEADDVSSRYDQCLDEVRGATCDVVAANPDQLPVSCSNVILFE